MNLLGNLHYEKMKRKLPSQIHQKIKQIRIRRKKK